MDIPTVKIVCEGVSDGFVIINEADFDHAQHVPFEEKSKEKVEAPAEEAPADCESDNQPSRPSRRGK